MSCAFWITSFLLFATIEGCTVPGLKFLTDHSGNIAFKRQWQYFLEDCTWNFPDIVSDYAVLVMMYNNVHIRMTRTKSGLQCSGEIWLAQGGEDESISYMYQGKRCGIFRSVCHVYWKKSSKCIPADIVARVVEMYPGCSLWWSTIDNQIEKLKYHSRYMATMDFNISYNILDCEPQSTKESPTTAGATEPGEATRETTVGLTTRREVYQSQTSQQQDSASPFPTQATANAAKEKTAQIPVAEKAHIRLKASHRNLAIMVITLSCLLLFASGILVWMYCRQRKPTVAKHSFSRSSKFGGTIETGSFKLNPAYEEADPDTAEVVDNVIYGEFSPQRAIQEDTYAVIYKGK